MTKFETNKSYEIGTLVNGQQPTVEVIKRTTKFVTLRASFCGDVRVKVQSFLKDVESVVLGGEIINADEECKSLKQQQKEF